MALTVSRAISEGGLLYHDFKGESWALWRVLMKAAFGQKMTAEEMEQFKAVAGGREPPPGRVRELWIVAGRRGGKDSIASAIATVMSLQDYSAYTRGGERVCVTCQAVNKEQAGIVHGYIAANFAMEKLKPIVRRQTLELIELHNGVDIVVAPNSFRSVRGRTIAVAILDEVAFWRSDDVANPDSEVYNAIVGSMLSIPEAMVIGISSPHQRRGLLFEKWRTYFGKDDDEVLVIHAPSLTLNPTLPKKIIERRLKEDPEAGAAEYLAEWRSDLSDFLSRDLVESCVDQGVTVRPPRAGVEYHMFCDASGGKGDSFCSCVAHAEENVIVVDALHETRSPFNAVNAVRATAALAKQYRVSAIQGDDFAAGVLSSMVAETGIRYERVKRDHSATYIEAAVLFTSGRAKLVENARMVHQFSQLERRAVSSGRDRVSHPLGTHDDLANAVAGALVMVAVDRRPRQVQLERMLQDGRGVVMPSGCDQVFATLIVGDDGVAGTCWFARNQHAGVPLTVLDFDVGPLASDTFGRVYRRGVELGELCRARRRVVTVMVEEARKAPADRELEATLWPLAAAGKMVWDASVRAIPREVLRDTERLGALASGHVVNNRVKLVAECLLKMQESPLGGALEFRAGGVDDDPLRLAGLAGIVLALCDERELRVR
jgi:hypothetical protein